MKWTKVSEKEPRERTEYHLQVCLGDVWGNEIGEYNKARNAFKGEALGLWYSADKVEWLDEPEDDVLESAIQLIKDIRHGNVYNDIPSVCEKWLIENGYAKL